jgi:DNA-directed RNA polymerase subunit RPC12/RpoP
MSIHEKLGKLQVNLKAPKGQFNSFGKYAYRSCEDILEAVKPLLSENGCTLIITDDVIPVADRIYVKATCRLTEIKTGEFVEVSACAREADEKRGMDSSQLTGATSSYARKYALGGLFALDDTKDADATNKHGKDNAQAVVEKAQAAGVPVEKEYKCCDCGKAFQAFTDKNGKTWSAGQVFHMSESNNTDGKARCSSCMKKAGTQKQKG